MDQRNDESGANSSPKSANLEVQADRGGKRWGKQQHHSIDNDDGESKGKKNKAEWEGDKNRSN